MMPKTGRSCPSCGGDLLGDRAEDPNQWCSECGWHGHKEADARARSELAERFVRVEDRPVPYGRACLLRVYWADEDVVVHAVGWRGWSDGNYRFTSRPSFEAGRFEVLSWLELPTACEFFPQHAMDIGAARDRWLQKRREETA